MRESKPQQIDIERYLATYRATGKPQVISFRGECPWIRGDRFTHLIHRYPAKLVAHIPAYFLASSLCPDNATVLDPFAGSGTVLLEALLSGHSALGSEINPVARLIAETKTTVYSTYELEEEAKDLLAFLKGNVGHYEIPTFPNVDLWFTPSVQAGLAKVKHAIETLSCLRHRDFFWLVFSSIVRRVALADPRVSPPVVLKPEKFAGGSVRHKQVQDMLRERRAADVVSLFSWAFDEQLKRFRRLEDEAKDHDFSRASIIWDDARTLSKAPTSGKGQLDKASAEPFPDASVDLVITSPPYLNAQKYARSLRLEWYWLGLGPYESLRAMDASMMGSERLFYSEYHKLQRVGHPIADQIIEEAHLKDPHRSRVLSKYYEDMKTCMRQIHRVLKPGGHFVLVVGNNRVFKRRVPNQDILEDFAVDQGFHLRLMLVDEIFSRGLMTKRNTTADVIPDEWILVLQK